MASELCRSPSSWGEELGHNCGGAEGLTLLPKPGGSLGHRPTPAEAPSARRTPPGGDEFEKFFLSLLRTMPELPGEGASLILGLQAAAERALGPQRATCFGGRGVWNLQHRASGGGLPGSPVAGGGRGHLGGWVPAGEAVQRGRGRAGGSHSHRANGSQPLPPAAHQRRSPRRWAWVGVSGRDSPSRRPAVAWDAGSVGVPASRESPSLGQAGPPVPSPLPGAFWGREWTQPWTPPSGSHEASGSLGCPQSSPCPGAGKCVTAGHCPWPWEGPSAGAASPAFLLAPQGHLGVGS